MKRYLVLAAAICLLLLSAGCGREKTENPSADTNGKPDTYLVIIAGRHANARMFTEKMLNTGGLLDRSIVFWTDYEAEKHHVDANVSVIISDGNPTKEDLSDVLTPWDGDNTSEGKDARQEMVDSLYGYLTGPDCVAQEPNVDLLKALSQAQKILNGYPDMKHTILILDTGLADAGILNMNKIDIFDEEKTIDEVLDVIQEGIPDLSGTEVTFVGLGNVAGTQTEFQKKSTEDRFLAFWTALLSDRAHGTLTSSLRISEADGEAMEHIDDESVYPFVSPIVIPEFVFPPPPTPTPDPGTSPTPGPTPPPPPVITIDDRIMNFKGDSGEFVSEDDEISARRVIQGLAKQLNDYLKDDPDGKIFVVGSSARTYYGQNDRTDPPAAGARAKTVSRLLTEECGISDRHIVTIDAGFTRFSWRNADEFPNGEAQTTQDKAVAASNRKVAIFTKNARNEENDKLLVSELQGDNDDGWFYLDSNLNPVDP